MERVPVDGDDRPEQEIKITGASVFVNPYKELEEEERKKAEAERKQASRLVVLKLSMGVFKHGSCWAVSGVSRDNALHGSSNVQQCVAVC